jgi:tRNA-2-methylthio-N6-dimethylallyladenosine synthase
VTNFKANPRLIGQFVNVTITAVSTHTLRGEIIVLE